ncbi:hypothetical protein QJS10_CPA01g00258 [Acorus calamus]|uniref:SSD domain-containing protein n=1 Tax=Acorus calamus TaxID=4465 RepID=A0AAV9FMT4_ACOCL|nr:hypothetical protein QJS10_CPA01g00258 [Acorus calamus]
MDLYWRRKSLLLWRLFMAISSSQIMGFISLADAQASGSQTPGVFGALSGDKHAPEYCAMYGICAQRSDGKVLNCPSGSPSVKPDDLLSAKIQSLCPTITGNVCCNADQFDTLRGQVQQAIPFLVGCPACLRNFLNLFCELSCSPNQSLFINVTSVAKVNNTLTVDGIDFLVTDTYGEELYNSCKEVKFGTMNTRAMAFIGAGAQNYKEWFSFIGRQADLDEPGSPYEIRFRSNILESSGMEPMNVSVYSCGDTSLGCSCGDCPSSPTCAAPAPPTPHDKGSCSIKIGSLKVECIEISMTILYVVLVSTFLGWSLLNRNGERRNTSRMKPLLNNKDGNELHSVNKQEPALSMQMPEGTRLMKASQLSLVQGYISSFYRRYGFWVARNPTLVLCSSLAIPLLLCIGLVHFRVETRPAKLWVGPGSKAAEEKQFFDSHLAPFYRIEQLILATTPTSKHEKPPSIVTEDNIKLLFKIQKSLSDLPSWQVDELRANHSGSMVSLTDICMKPLDADCATQSVLQYFKMDPEKYDDYGGVDHAAYCFQHYSSAETCLSAFQAPVDPSTALGGFSGTNYSEASAFVITYPVNNEVDKTGNENGKAVAWEKAFIRLTKEELMPMVLSQNLTLSFSSESSIEEELKRESAADVVTILISYLVMFAYISVTLGDAPHLSTFYISSKVLLGLSGILVVMLSVLGSIGFFSAIGVKSTLIIMEVIPFLVLAVGVDNMCILVHAVKRQPFELPIEGRITLAVLLDFLLQVTAFVALIIFDSLRAEDNRIDCFPCIKIPRSTNEIDKGNGHREPGLLTRYMRVLCTRIQPGLEQKVVLPRDSYLQDYFDDLAEYLRVGPPLYFVVKDYNYSVESKHTNQLCSINQCDPDSLLNEIARASQTPKSSYIAKPAASWLDDFLVWLSPEAFGCCRKFTNGSYCPPDDQPPCCTADEGSCGMSLICKDCTTSDYVNSLRAAREFSSKISDSLKPLELSDHFDCVGNDSCGYDENSQKVSNGDRGQRAKEALGTMGASVFSGITLTKLVGVIVLRFAKSEVFVVVLSICGPPSRPVFVEDRLEHPPVAELS